MINLNNTKIETPRLHITSKIHRNKKKYPGLNCPHFRNGGQCIHCIRSYQNSTSYSSSNYSNYGSLFGGSYSSASSGQTTARKNYRMPTGPGMSTRSTKRG